MKHTLTDSEAAFSFNTSPVKFSYKTKDHRSVSQDFRILTESDTFYLYLGSGGEEVSKEI